MRKDLAMRKQVVELWKRCDTLAGVGAALGISRERVRQIILEETGMGVRAHRLARAEAFLKEHGVAR